jgi:sugar transferase EpsL
MKRVMDLVIAIPLLLLFSLVMIIISMGIRIQMGAPIIFKQQRPGLHGRLFFLYKFRTMNHKTNCKGHLLPDEDRLTSFGALLRKYSMDELPQLINVIKGDMSLVGPRPLLKEYLPLYTEDQNLRHWTKPGITGWAQINGRNEISWEEKFELDTWYVKNRTIWLDLKILFITIKRVVKKDGITQVGHVSTEKFNGTDEVV